MRIKICGVKDQDTLNILIQNGVDFVGFVFYKPSPRFVSIESFKSFIPLTGNLKSVGLFVDPSDEEIFSVIDVQGIHSQKKPVLNYIQLHGQEMPERVLEIKKHFGCPVIKAISIRTSEDVRAIDAYEEVSDWILCDAKPLDESLPGGGGVSFDWSLLAGRVFKKPWMLAGGLTSESVKRALSILTPDAVDVSSGVESVRGQKDAYKIIDFIKTVRDLS